MSLPFPHRARAAAAAALTALIAVASFAQPRRALAAAQAPTSVLDGVYTDAQARRGQKIFVDSCQTCHGESLTGTAGAPPLVGADFLADFGGMTVGDLFSKVLKTMPSDDPGTLLPPQAAEVLAFVLSQNKWPAGERELGTDVAALKQIRILTK
jgi:cytochrome c